MLEKLLDRKYSYARANACSIIYSASSKEIVSKRFIFVYHPQQFHKFPQIVLRARGP